MNVKRNPAVAGRFYPAAADTLRDTITGMLDGVTVPADDTLARAYVVPHAGYRFSGPIAAHVYARLRHHAARVNRIVLVGPSHFVPLTGMAASPAEVWVTPLGEVATTAAPGIPADPAVHAREHSLEVQLPFLQECVKDVEVLPIAVGKSAIADTVAELDRLVTDDTLLLCSTDLSHYHDDATARRLDRATADAVIAGDAERIRPGDACGVHALRGTVAWAARHGLPVTELQLRNSSDTFGTPDRVVGYPAFAFG